MPQRWIAAVFALLLVLCVCQAAPVEYLTGVLRGIDQAKLSLDTGDNRIVVVQIQSGMKYSSTMGKVKAADFEPGDRVTVEATKDENGQYSTKSVTMNKKGSPEDKAAALSAVTAPPPTALQTTAPPTAAPPTAAAPVPSAPVQGAEDPIIGKARDAAFSFSDTLPNYIVKQTTNRYKTTSANGGDPVWAPLDVVVTDLIYENGKDHYMNSLVNGRPTTHVELTGSWSEGEFANLLQAIFSTKSNTEFRNQKSVVIHDRPAWRYEYSVDQEHSIWIIHSDGRDTKPACVGSVWIDKETFRVLRMEMAARALASDFPLDTSETSVDYGMVTIGDKSVLLPVDADSLSCTRGTPECNRERTVFREYKKFEADSSVSFDKAEQPR